MNLGRGKDFCIWLLLWFSRQQGKEPVVTTFLHLGTGALGLSLATCREGPAHFQTSALQSMDDQGSLTHFRGNGFIPLHVQPCPGSCHSTFFVLSLQLWNGYVCLIWRNLANWIRWGHIVRLRNLFLLGCRIYFSSFWTTLKLILPPPPTYWVRFVPGKVHWHYIKYRKTIK